MWVKICGVTRLEDALAAAKCGADAIGFIFAQESSRRVNTTQVREIVGELPTEVETVGVFVNADRDLIVRTCQEAGVRSAQLHGTESPAELFGFPFPVYKAFRVPKGFDPSTLGGFPGPRYLLDAPKGEGPFDWRTALEAASYGEIIVAGGLTPGNVTAAIAASHPWGIDVSRGVESSPGVKDIAKMKELFREVR